MNPGKRLIELAYLFRQTLLDVTRATITHRRYATRTEGH